MIHCYFVIVILFDRKPLIELGVDNTKLPFFSFGPFLLAPEPIIKGEDGLILQTQGAHHPHSQKTHCPHNLNMRQSFAIILQMHLLCELRLHQASQVSAFSLASCGGLYISHVHQP